MSENEFRRLVARVERAASHRHELWRLGAEHLKANPIERRVVGDGDIRSFRLHATAPVPTELSLIFGEWLYQLRAALDGLMYEIVVRETKLDPPPNAGRISYPLCRSADAFASCNTYGVSDRIRRAIERTQPYHATGGFSGSALWWIHELARIDRHRRGHCLVWRIVELQVNSNSPAIDTSRCGVCNRFEAFIRGDEELEAAWIALRRGIELNSNDGVDITWRLQFDVADWVQRIPRSYGVWSLDDRMANAEMYLSKTIELFEQLFIVDDEMLA
ncbi:hypothetical protein [Corynebacterium amycolatum]|uniref:hypothetical protein n=1 Tax=Corynebacterium amycolatum TaxID=43765 RepID=UPI002119E89E|nr:hypothetical protein [Corynebacterium amycolatum]MCQ9125550.1 hypothetical protein [Corynebacterium amycolatum]